MVTAMTTHRYVYLTCPGCNESFTEQYSPSICTWLDPGLIQDIYNQGYSIQCPHCEHKIPIEGKVLINGPTGMFYLDVGLDIVSIRDILWKQGVVDHTGKVLDAREQIHLLQGRTETQS